MEMFIENLGKEESSIKHAKYDAKCQGEERMHHKNHKMITDHGSCKGNQDIILDLIP